MVNNPSLRCRTAPLRPTGDPKHWTDAARRIRGGPLYDLARVQERLRQMGPEGIRVINEDAALDMVEAFDPPFTEDELLSLLLALLPEEDFFGSVWCRTGVGMVIDCDAYTVHYNRNRGCRWPPGRKAYVKIGFREPQLPCIVVSIHPSRY